MALLGWENAIETSSTSLVASAAADGASAEQLRVPIGAASVAWQTPAGTTAAALTVTATAAVAWRAVCLGRTNLTIAATIRVRVGSAASITSAPAYDSGTVAAVEVVEYDWNEDGLTIGHIHSQLKHVEIGVIGQQAVEQVPEMFEAGPVPLPNGDTEYRMTFHPEKAVPYLIRAIQQQQELIVTLTARLAAIEAATSAGGSNA